MEGVTRRTCLAMGAAPVLAGVAAYAVGEGGLLSSDEPRYKPDESARGLLQQRHLPNVPLVTHEGQQVRFYNDLVKDKKVVFTFVSSRAPAQSRKLTQNLAAVQKFFGWRIGTDIYLYSIARNPERDTVPVLNRWARRAGAGPGWKFLTGEPADVQRLRRGLGFVSDIPGEDADPAYSVALLRYGSEPEMRWAHCQSLAAPRVIAHSMVLDFGNGQLGPGAPPIWNCRLLASEVR